MIELLAERFNFIIVIILMMTGLYAVIATGNLVKRLVGLSLFQTSVFLLYITLGKVFGGQPPILPAYGEAETGGQGDGAYHTAEAIYSNPLPHVLILTAIVVGIATTSLALALIVRIREEYNTIDEAGILEIESAIAMAENRVHGEAMGGRG